MTPSENPDKWQWRIGNHNIRVEDPHLKPSMDNKSNANFKNLDEVYVNVYVTKFPETLNDKNIWRLCERHSAVPYVYFARKH